MRTCGHALVALVLLLGVVVVAANSSLVLADSCTAQLGNPLTPMYYTSNGQIVMPLSAICSFAGGQLYAVGNAVDNFGENLGSTNTILTSINGGNVFNGQLLFNVPPSVQGNAVQISVSIYGNGPNGSLLTSVTQTVQGYYANNSYPGYYWYYPSYPSYPSYQWYPSDPSPPPEHYDHDHSTPPSIPPSTPPVHHDNPTPPSTHPPTPPPHHDNPTPPSTPNHDQHH